jgi:hypothetical protein
VVYGQADGEIRVTGRSGKTGKGGRCDGVTWELFDDSGDCAGTGRGGRFVTEGATERQPM